MGVLFSLGTGLFLIIIGFLAGRYPILISGYNTLQKEHDKIDLKAYSRFIRNCFFVIGGMIISVSSVLTWLKMSHIIGTAVLIILFLGVFLTLFLSRKYSKGVTSSRTNTVSLWIVLITIFSVVLVTIYVAEPAGVRVESNVLYITGVYGTAIPLEKITKVEVLKTLPSVRMRTNGLSIGMFHKGNYRMENIGRVKLYLHSGKPPYLIIYSEGHVPIIINRSTPEKIEHLYQQLKKEQEPA